jgi:hypothetical protein
MDAFEFTLRVCTADAMVTALTAPGFGGTPVVQEVR